MEFKNRVFKIILKNKTDYENTKRLFESHTFWPINIPPLRPMKSNDNSAIAVGGVKEYRAVVVENPETPVENPYNNNSNFGGSVPVPIKLLDLPEFNCEYNEKIFKTQDHFISEIKYWYNFFTTNEYIQDFISSYNEYIAGDGKVPPAPEMIDLPKDNPYYGHPDLGDMEKIDYLYYLYQDVVVNDLPSNRKGFNKSQISYYDCILNYETEFDNVIKNWQKENDPVFFDYRQIFIYMNPIPEELALLIYTRNQTFDDTFNYEVARHLSNFRDMLIEQPEVEPYNFTDIVNGRRTMTGRYAFLSYQYPNINNTRSAQPTNVENVLNPTKPRELG